MTKEEFDRWSGSDAAQLKAKNSSSLNGVSNSIDGTNCNAISGSIDCAGESLYRATRAHSLVSAQPSTDLGKL